MKYLRSLWLCAFVLSFVPSLASADEPSLVDWTRQRVEAGILKPLAAREGSRFSRARPPPHERRVRVTQATLIRDKQGRDFVPFAVDVRFGGDWQQDDIVGCAYRASGALFVKRGDDYFPAAFLAGKDVAPVAGVCQAAAARS
ncbi:MAG TPA: hypothetical protein VHV51_20240 [Polyangiaceae bacterium]|nr:hypothetical protein [Polyangiaceae bacterium]